MALTLLNSPLKISPVYNPNWFVYNSTNVSQQNFDYVFDIYQSTGTTLATSPILRVRVPPEPDNLYGVYNPQRILQSFVKPSFTPELTGCTPQSFVEYTFKVGEAYTLYTTWTTSGITNFNGVVRNNFITTTPHYFQAGDNVLLTQTGGTGNFGGVFEVLSAVTPTRFIVNLPLVIGIGNGTSVLSTLSPTIFSGLSTASGYSSHNAAIDTIDFIDYNPIDYYPNTDGLSPFYTDTPNGWKVRKDNHCVLGYITEYTSTALSAVTSGYTGVNRLKITTKNSSNNNYEYYIPLTCSKEVMHIGVGGWNLNNSSGAVALTGSLPIIQNDTIEYSVTLQNTNISFVDITFASSTGATINRRAIQGGIYNGRPYYQFKAYNINFYIWYNSTNGWWEVSNALGGGNDYLQSATSGTTQCPPIGVYGVEWNDGSNPYFTAFTSSNCDYYDLMKPFTFNIYEYCGKWDNFEIVFMDRKGNWIPFNFELVQRKTITSDRGTFKKGLGKWNGSKITYNSYDRGSTNYRNIINYQYTIISNWFNENQSLYYEELFSSPEVYWNYDGNGTFVAINLTQTGEEIKDKKNTRLIQYTLQFNLANNPIVQTGS
jgi:hypothetical protein